MENERNTDKLAGYLVKLGGLATPSVSASSRASASNSSLSYCETRASTLFLNAINKSRP